MVGIKNTNQEKKISIKNTQAVTYKSQVSKIIKNNNIKIKKPRKKSMIKDEEIEKQNQAVKEKNKLIIKYLKNVILPKL